MGKWSGLRGKYPDLPYDDATKEAIDALTGTDRQALIEEINRLREEKANLEAQVKDIEFDLSVYEKALIRDMDATGLDSFTSGGYLWTRSEEPHPQVTDREANVMWALDHEPSVLSIQWQSLKALVKHALQHPGEENVMPHGVSIYMKPALSRRKKS